MIGHHERVTYQPPASTPIVPSPGPAPAFDAASVSASVLPPALPPDATTGGLAFHRLVFARKRRGWWTPLAVGGLGVAMYVALLIVLMIGIVVAGMIDSGVMDALMRMSENPTSIDLKDPFIVALALGTIAMMWPCYLLASLIVNGPRVGLISSAAGRLRWAWMLQCALAAAVIAAVLTALSYLIPGANEGGGEANPMWLASLIIVVLLVPVQATAEEYVFRGYLAQAIGRWLRHPAYAILLPVPLFVLGHLYDWMGQLGVGIFAVAAGWLTWRTGGLEAAIALHIVNNLAGFLLGLATGSDPTATETGVVSLLWSVLVIGCYVGTVEWMLRRRPLARTLVLTPPTAAPPAWAPPIAPPPAAASPVWTPPAPPHD